MPWAFVFERVDTVPRHPAQLYEALAYFVIFGLIWFMYKKIKVYKEGLFLELVYSASLFSVSLLSLSRKDRLILRII